MRAPISVIIPTLNAERALPACLGALAEGLNAGLIRELVICDGGSTDDTVQIAQAAGAEIVHAAASRGGQLQRACAAAQGTWLLVLHADTQLQPDWSRAAMDVLPRPGAYYAALRFDEPSFAAQAVAGWANLRARWLGLPYGDQGLLIHRDVYDAAGGYPDIPLMEDVAIARALKGRLRPLAMVAQTSAARYRRDGWLRRGARNLGLLMRYLLGADPAQLARAYRK